MGSRTSIAACIIHTIPYHTTSVPQARNRVMVTRGAAAAAAAVLLLHARYYSRLKRGHWSFKLLWGPGIAAKTITKSWSYQPSTCDQVERTQVAGRPPQKTLAETLNKVVYVAHHYCGGP